MRCQEEVSWWEYKGKFLQTWSAVCHSSQTPICMHWCFSLLSIASSWCSLLAAAQNSSKCFFFFFSFSSGYWIKLIWNKHKYTIICHSYHYIFSRSNIFKLQQTNRILFFIFFIALPCWNTLGPINSSLNWSFLSHLAGFTNPYNLNVEMYVYCYYPLVKSY